MTRTVQKKSCVAPEKRRYIGFCMKIFALPNLCTLSAERGVKAILPNFFKRHKKLQQLAVTTGMHHTNNFSLTIFQR